LRAILIRRLATAIPTLLAVILLSFVLMRAAPGSPFDSERPLDPATRAAFAAAYGLDKPLPEQAARYLGGVLTGDFGPSLVYKDFTVGALIGQGLPVSLTLGGLALLLALALGIGAATFAGTHAGGWADRTIMTIATLLTAIPTFVTGPALALVFALWLQLLPVSGLDGAASLVLPVVALALPVAGAIARLARAGLAVALAQDHVLTARARGLALPGLGRYFVQGALNRDYPLVLGVVILYAGLILLFNLIADLAYGWLDPRVRG
jgi:oligopeptide transport system permease protein